ncbi:hypothetical protein BGX34_002158 [Mortierella sp. NVP85]|nr:hypothetical protein BGX34_002158 [Mortierella sp. NVP85]
MADPTIYKHRTLGAGSYRLAGIDVFHWQLARAEIFWNPGPIPLSPTSRPVSVGRPTSNLEIRDWDDLIDVGQKHIPYPKVDVKESSSKGASSVTILNSYTSGTMSAGLLVQLSEATSDTSEYIPGPASSTMSPSTIWLHKIPATTVASPTNPFARRFDRTYPYGSRCRDTLSELNNLGKSVELFLERNVIRKATAPYVDNHLRFLMADDSCSYALFVGGRSVANEVLRLYEQDMFDTVVDEFLEQQSMRLWQRPFSLDPSYYQLVGGLTKDRIAEMAAKRSRCCVEEIKPLRLKKSTPVDVALQTEPPVVDGAQSVILTDHKDKSAEEDQEEQEDKPLERNNPSRAVLSDPKQSDSTGCGDNSVATLVDLADNEVGSRDDGCSDCRDGQLRDSDAGTGQDCHSQGHVPDTIRPPSLLGQLGLLHSELVDEKIGRAVDSLQAELERRKSSPRASLKRSRDDDDLNGDINDISAKIMNLLNLCNTSQESKDLYT